MHENSTANSCHYNIICLPDLISALNLPTLRNTKVKMCKVEDESHHTRKTLNEIKKKKKNHLPTAKPVLNTKSKTEIGY